MEIKDIEFNTNDWKKMSDLMQHHKDFSMPLAGKNEDNENIVVEIYKDKILVRTYQHNGWCRTNVYWDDGTVEELYDK